MLRWTSALFLVASFVGCGSTTSSEAEEQDPESSTLCESDNDCTDDLFCTGKERCLASSDDADSRGCVGGFSPCGEEGACKETEASCGLCGDDDDGDGHVSIECGGSDCDDGDSERYPRAEEICDDDGKDEDCDPSTYGERDLDKDGEVDIACCNTDGGKESCGIDCDDSLPAVSTTGAEVCNGVDDDCDGLVDDIINGEVVCSSGSSDPEPCMTSDGIVGTRSCAADCLGFNKCLGPEVCNGIDDNGDGAADEDFDCELGSVKVCKTACGSNGVRQCDEGCTLGACTANEVCNFCDDDGMLGIAAEVSLATVVDGPRILEPDGISNATEQLAGAAVETSANPNGNYQKIIRLLDGTVNEQAGAYWVNLERYLGWGATTIIVQMRVNSPSANVPVGGWKPIGGWSVVIATEGTELVGPAKNRGVPYGRGGARFDWIWGQEALSIEGPELPDANFYSPSGQPGQWRGMDIQNPDLTPGFTSYGNHFDGQTTPVTQTMGIIYQPENPFTLATEEKVTLAFHKASAATCVTSTTCGSEELCLPVPGSVNSACYASRSYVPEFSSQLRPDNDIPLASVLSIGVTAGIYPSTFQPPNYQTLYYGAPVIADLVIKSVIQPPAGSSVPERVEPYSFITRAGVCQGDY